MKNDTDDGVESLADREAAPDKISVFFQHSVGRPEASVKSSRSNDPYRLNSKSGERDYDTFVVARRVPLIATNLPTDVLIKGVRSRNAHSRSSSIMSASVRAQSSALCARHCSPFHRPTVSCPRMNRDARLRVTNRKAALRLFIAATPLYLSS